MNEIIAIADMILDLLDNFLENLISLIVDKPLSSAESRLDPEDFLTEMFRIARFLEYK